ncbi:glycoside hydrolase [Bacillus sp. HMF5848]|uniref:GH32 C-terminal domain-containing protein n=1 Tax=Bacillus sp. HMF5848 TaxID=2495421 RepID=UPI000F7B79A0|nr:GH32 C-terminal domain-containing protein [Bacillus sp. HMF5848]RSK28738.1 glycoside hydrolase [Bacillus sp. HMF5848]
MSLIYNLAFSEGEGNTTTEHIRGHELQIEYVFQDAKYKNSCSPRWIKSPLEGFALDFDGYSTYIVDAPIEVSGSFSIMALIAPRCFEACHGNVSTTIIDQLDKTNKKGFALSLYQHGELQFEIGDGTRLHMLRSEQSIDLFTLSQIWVVYSQEAQKLSVYLNGRLIASLEGTAFMSANIPVSIGLNNVPFKIGPIFKGGMFTGLIERIQMFDEAIPQSYIEEQFAFIQDKLNLDFKNIDLDETRLLDDVHRPQYHAIPPQHWMNEPHAPFYFNGKYHLFYQKNASGPYFSNLHWGHWTSDDMVFWKNEKTALFPQKGDLTPSGVWSGSATIGPNDVPLLFYTSANFNKEYNQGVATARPKNVEDPNLVEWKMDDKGVITQTDKQGILSQFRDPFVWKDELEDKWYAIIGGGIEGKGPTAWIYTSIDCKEWSFQGEFLTCDSEKYPYLGSNWELPVFLPVSDDEGNKKYVFMFMSYFIEETVYQVDTYYYIGEFDRERATFIPNTDEPQLFDYGRFKFSGPSGFVDPVSNKSIVFSILQGDRTEQEEFEAGWAHNAGLPIELFLENNELRIRPLENLQVLRADVLIDEENTTVCEVNEKLKSINEKMIEVIVEFADTDSLVGLEIKKDPSNLEKTTLLYDKRESYVSLDRRKSKLGSAGDIHGGPLEITTGLKAHIFIDHSTIECFLNDKKMITSRAYPTSQHSDYMALIGDKHIQVKSLRVYKLKSIWKRNE